MDPVATLKNLDEALIDGDRDGIAEFSGYLIDWLKGGGFAPFESDYYETDWRAKLSRGAFAAYLRDVRRAATAKGGDE